MKRLFGLTVIGLALGLAAAPATAPQTKEEKIEAEAAKKAPAITPDKVVPYRSVDGKDLVLNCFFPKNWKASDTRPAIIFFHGGGWSAGAPTQFYIHARYYSDRGFVTICPSYRLGKTGEDIYNGVADAKSAVRFIRSHAAEFGLNPDRMTFAGSSAGAHLSLSAMLSDEVNNPGDDLKISTAPQGIILFCPVVNCGPEGYAPAYRRLGETYPKVSPAGLLREKMAPMIMLLGSKDSILTEAKANAFADAVAAKGSSCQVVMFPDLKHGAFYAEKNFLAASEAINKFLAANKLGD